MRWVFIPEHSAGNRSRPESGFIYSEGRPGLGGVPDHEMSNADSGVGMLIELDM